MCSVGDDNFDDIEANKYLPEKPSSKPLSSQKCNKCKTAMPCVMLRGKDSYCKDCFLSGTTHKFRATLGKHKVIRPGDKVLLVHKGGPASTALLHFTRTGLEQNSHKKLRFEAEVIFVENNCDLEVEQRIKLLDDVRKECQKFGFKCHSTTLAALIEGESTAEPKENDSNIVRSFVGKQTQKSLQIDYLAIITNNFLIEEAKKLSCKIVFTPELSTDIASQILTDVSLGRGSQIPMKTGFLDDRNDTVTILRPLRTFDLKEVTLYNHYNDLEPVVFPKAPQKASFSVQSLMEKFVSDLQVNYPATVTTIIKTGEKLQCSNNERRCEMCQATMPVSHAELTAEEATQFSHRVSTQRPDFTLHPVARYNAIVQSFECENYGNFCYGCSNLK